MQNRIIQSITAAHQKPRPRMSVGDNVTVHVRLKEGDKERVQPFRGVVIARKNKSGKGVDATITVRKISEGVGVERVFPLASPAVEKIEVHSGGEVRRSKLYYLRELTGKKARLTKKEAFSELIVPDEAIEIVPELAEPIEEEAKEAQAAKSDAPAEDKAESKPAEGDAAPAEDKKPE